MVSALSTKGPLGERVIWEFRVGVKLSEKACIQAADTVPSTKEIIYPPNSRTGFFFFLGGGLVFRDKVALCSFGCPKTHYVHQAILELIKMCLLLLPKSWD